MKNHLNTTAHQEDVKSSPTFSQLEKMLILIFCFNIVRMLYLTGKTISFGL